jgi:hypothetical protein
VGKKPKSCCAPTVFRCPLLKNKWAKAHFFWAKAKTRLANLCKNENKSGQNKTKVGKKFQK